MTIRNSAVVWASAAALAMALVACGAGETSGSAVTGVALSDAPISGTVTITDSSATVQTRSVSTRADGSFSVDVADLTPPYMLRVADGGTTRLYAVTEGNDNLDVNPITDMAFSVASEGSDEDEVFRSSDREEKRSRSSKAGALLAKLQAVLAPLLERYGITDPRVDKVAVRALLEDVKVRRDDGVVTVTNRETGAVIFEGPLRDLASGTFDPTAMPDGPGTTPLPAGTCTSFTYSDWGTCTNGSQRRTVLTASPSGCTGGAPVTTQACTVTPPPVLDGAALYQQHCAGCHGSSKLGSSAASISSAIASNLGGMGTTALRALTAAQIAAIAAAGTPAPATCTGFTYSSWGTCTNGTQTRTVLSSVPSGCTGGNPITSQSCTVTPPPPATCTSFTYSAWGTCTNGSQSRTVTASMPSGCTGGAPVTTQACTAPPPAIDGAALYTQYCAGCHGNSMKGSSASSISAAIASNRGGMGSTALRALTAAQIAAIAAAP